MKIKSLKNSSEDINNFLFDNQYNEDMENLYINGYYDEIDIKNSTWTNSGAGFYTKESELVGWIEISRSRPMNILNVDFMTVIDKRYTVSIFRFVRGLLHKEMDKATPKITMSTMVGSYAESLWDKLIYTTDFKIVGVDSRQCRDKRGNIRDMKRYEKLNESYMGVPK